TVHSMKASLLKIGIALVLGAAAWAGASAGAPDAEVRESGLQITPDQHRVLINKDVEDQRWSITRNLDDLTVTGNVFFPEGRDPRFLFCQQQAQVGDDVQLRCSGADACSDTSCPEFAVIGDVTIPESFFEPPVATAQIAARIQGAVSPP